ncbi:glycosyltransferase family 39 protein [Candidatus Wolfebacteria bacterium]|nr:glycosyltransferase family 39 protein [Candidatus Wolfebacteria bacterium]
MEKNKIIILIFSLALLSGFFWNYPMFGQPVSSDQVLYEEVAQNILSGKGFAYNGKDAGIEPVYPLFLAGVYKVFGHNYDVVRIIQIVLFALSIVFVYLLSGKIFGFKIAIWSSLITTSFYGIANQAGSLTTETFFIFLLMIFVWFLYKASHENKYKWFAASGISLGLATLTRGIIQYFFIVAVINFFIVFYKKISLKEVSFKIGVFIISFFIILTPWLLMERLIGGVGMAVVPKAGGGLIARVEKMEKIYPNYAGHFVGHLFGYFFSEKLGLNAKYEDYRQVAATDARIAELMKSGKSETEIDQILSAEAKDKILKAPQKYILISIIDFISFNSPILPQKSNFQNTLEIHPMFAEGRHPEIPDWEKAAIILTVRGIWFLFLFFAVYGAAKSVKNPRRDGGASWQKFGWILLIIFYFNLAYSAIHAIPRYALPIYPFYIMLCVIGLMKFYEKIKS